MNHFERGQDPKKAMGVGVKKDAIEIINLGITLRASSNTGESSCDVNELDVRLRKKAKLEDILPFLGMDSIPSSIFFKYLIPKEKAENRSRRKIIREFKRLAKNSFKPSDIGRITIGEYTQPQYGSIKNSNFSKVVVIFEIDTSEEEMREVKLGDKKMKGVIYKGQVYPVLNTSFETVLS